LQIDQICFIDHSSDFDFVDVEVVDEVVSLILTLKMDRIRKTLYVNMCERVILFDNFLINKLSI